MLYRKVNPELLHGKDKVYKILYYVVQESQS